MEHVNLRDLPSSAMPLPRCRETAWFLDIDGTLVDISTTPGGVVIDKSLRTLLTRLYDAADGAVALITGRTLKAADQLFDPLRFPVAGQHGLEWRDASGTVHRHDQGARHIDAVRPLVIQWAAQWPPLLVEDKGLSLALHYRKAPGLEGAVHAFLGELVDGADQNLHLQPGKMVCELRPTGRDKGTAIRDFLAQAPFAGRQPVFAGDDMTDEFGFAAVNSLDGMSIKVGMERSTARWRLPNVAATRGWLAACLAQEIP